MKTILAVLAASVLFAQTASSIPQTIGAGFLGAVGMSFEQYAASPGPWAPDAELKGPWHRRGTQPEKAGVVVTYDLGVDATVFGIPAAQVSAERTDGKVLRFTVRFDESKLKNGKARTVALLDQVLANITALSYQPMDRLAGSLSSADLHLVVMGDAFVGIVHPCKIYNILTLGIPFLFVGPEECHVSDLTLRLNEPAHARLARQADPGVRA